MQQSPAYLVERFYYDLWNTANETLAWEILHPDFRFRASLGPEKIGPCGFIEYMRLIHTALSSYWCTPGDAGDRRTRRSPIAFQWSPSRHVLRHASNRPRDRVDRCSLLSHHRPSDRFPMGLGRRRCRQTATRRSVDKLRSVRPPRLIDIAARVPKPRAPCSVRRERSYQTRACTIQFAAASTTPCDVACL